MESAARAEQHTSSPLEGARENAIFANFKWKSVVYLSFKWIILGEFLPFFLGEMSIIQPQNNPR